MAVYEYAHTGLAGRALYHAGAQRRLRLVLLLVLRAPLPAAPHARRRPARPAQRARQRAGFGLTPRQNYAFPAQTPPSPVAKCTYNEVYGRNGGAVVLHNGAAVSGNGSSVIGNDLAVEGNDSVGSGTAHPFLSPIQPLLSPIQPCRSTTEPCPSP